MKAKEIRDLIDFIAGTGLEEVNIETDEFKVKVKRSAEINIQSAPVVMPSMVAQNQTPAPETSTPKMEDEAVKSNPNFVKIKSPMIGTFYESPNPDSAPFIKIGDVVNVGDTVCIIEAMKLFNEIESEVSGKIVEILVDNSTPVEYDQPLFLVDPS